ncbi:hypothetical protein RhiirA4_454975 [Rhizophagus irregularis]|uniref:Uncharacterized protein n=1 Tax=Rhizophagus irregularis TaxID=588596 RepID=A0A2I1G4A0_9GLOM|nr:hypothetical protein RhiirA4_454975 [Rhizophagus irregularis]
MESVFDLLREENARLMAKITGQASSFEKAELKTKNAKLRKRFAKLEEKQLENKKQTDTKQGDEKLMALLGLDEGEDDDNDDERTLDASNCSANVELVINQQEIKCMTIQWSIFLAGLLRILCVKKLKGL